LEHPGSETGRAIDRVRTYLSQGRTGCVRVQVPARAPCAVYLNEGELIAALCPADPQAIVRRLAARGRLNTKDLARLKASGSDLDFETLHRWVDSSVVGRLMSGRFRNNLVFSLFDAGRFAFEPADTIRVPHLQIGHDSAGLLRELEVLHDGISFLMTPNREYKISLGQFSPGTPQQRHIHALCASPTNRDDLLAMSPFTHAQTLSLVATMTEAGSLLATPLAQGPAQGAIAHAVAVAEASRQRRAVASQSRDGVGVKPLAAFEDHDRENRGMGKGMFVGDKERVVLGSSGRSPGLRLSAPTLSNTEVLRRVGVCNEVLTALVAVWTEQHGPGTGRIVAQQLVDGAPRGFSALFQGAEVDAMGRLGVTHILDNLQRRAPAERRDLVTRGLCCLIDRTLGWAAEGLDEIRLGKMLDQVAGYRARMGW